MYIFSFSFQLLVRLITVLWLKLNKQKRGQRVRRKCYWQLFIDISVTTIFSMFVILFITMQYRIDLDILNNHIFISVGWCSLAFSFIVFTNGSWENIYIPSELWWIYCYKDLNDYRNTWKRISFSRRLSTWCYWPWL